jgi:hypothetical protein
MIYSKNVLLLLNSYRIENIVISVEQGAEEKIELY